MVCAPVIKIREILQLPRSCSGSDKVKLIYTNVFGEPCDTVRLSLRAYCFVIVEGSGQRFKKKD